MRSCCYIFITTRLGNMQYLLYMFTCIMLIYKFKEFRLGEKKHLEKEALYKLPLVPVSWMVLNFEKPHPFFSHHHQSRNQEC